MKIKLENIYLHSRRFEKAEFQKFLRNTRSFPLFGVFFMVLSKIRQRGDTVQVKERGEKEREREREINESDCF